MDSLHFHTFRHSFATRCLESGMDVKSLSEVLGHSSCKITLDTYVHVFDGSKKTRNVADGKKGNVKVSRCFDFFYF
ncbi:tyrosine-type recombinase/integrase [Dubosiella newyorkensis]|uniref:tyrosine-type recombinase/integrase n=1 Tax=Dubosiella newyorkensis TaxID=1862672 RepID=UPI003F67E973